MSGQRVNPARGFMNATHARILRAHLWNQKLQKPQSSFTRAANLFLRGWIGMGLIMLSGLLFRAYAICPSPATHVAYFGRF